MISTTARAAASTVANGATRRPYDAGFGTSRSHAFVTTARVPSLPTRRPFRSYPATSFRVFPPVTTTAPLARTASSARTQRPVTPYFAEWGPPAFSATFPPIVHEPLDPGSGG